MKTFLRFLILAVLMVAGCSFALAQGPVVDTTGLSGWNPFENPVTVGDMQDAYNTIYGALVIVWGYVARLFGCVDDCFVRARADDDAACVPGVVDVENLVAVRDATFHAFDPYVDATPLECYGWFRYEPWLTFDDDGEIAARVEEELWWSPFVNSGDVAVTCVDGVVQLDGEVGSETERIAATENAFDAGAIWVDNDLEVMPDEGSKQ